MVELPRGNEPGFRVWGLEFGVWGFGFGFGVWGPGFRLEG
jgi:hypothetical protein